jgi:hypothetical protein
MATRKVLFGGLKQVAVPPFGAEHAKSGVFYETRDRTRLPTDSGR